MSTTLNQSILVCLQQLSARGAEITFDSLALHLSLSPTAVDPKTPTELGEGLRHLSGLGLVSFAPAEGSVELSFRGLAVATALREAQAPEVRATSPKARVRGRRREVLGARSRAA